MDRIMLVGCRHLIEVLNDRLRHHGLNPSTVCAHADERREKVDSEKPLLEKRERIKADLNKAGIEKAKMVVVLEERDEDGLLVCRMSRQLFGVDNIIAWVQDPQHMEEFRRTGARVVNPALSTTLFLESLILNADTYEQVGDIDEIEIHQIKLKSNRAVGARVDELELPQGVRVMSIQRGGDMLVPNNDTRLRENDTLNVTGRPENLKEALLIFNHPKPD
jgi:trk system potassium uptake protein TrkA